MRTKNLRRLYFNKKIERMTKRNQNWIAVVVGATGDGKTYGALEISDDMMDRKHDPYVHQVFSISEFVQKLNRGVFKKAHIVVFEEAGVNISSKDWQSKANKNINFVLQTVRHRNFGIIFTLPIYRFLDSSTRALIHSLFIAEGDIDYDTQIARLKVYDFKIDAYRSTEPYRIIPKFWVDGQLVAMRKIQVKMPRKELIDVYEARKTEFTDNLNQEIENQLLADEREKKQKTQKVKMCPDCSGTWWTYYKKTKDWACRRCGYRIDKSPYNQNDD